MPDDVTVYLLLVVALAIGYLLGRHEPGRRRNGMDGSGERYLPSLHQIVNDQRGLDMEEYVESLVAHDDPVETRLALGALVRRRGEMDRAIRVHQGLLARTGLDADQRSRIELELARDYLAAGLLGRAEKLLLDLAGRDGPERVTAQRGLLEIYQREREWQQAVEVGRTLARHDHTMHARLAHFQCELAECALAEGDLRQARQALALGREFDAGCARLSLIGARVELEAGYPQDACRALRRAVTQDADCVPLAVPLYRRAADALDDEDGFVGFLDTCLEHGAYLPAVEARAGLIEAERGAAAATQFLMDQLLRNPSLGGFVSLLEHLDRDGQPLGPEQLAQVRRFSESLLRRQAVHRCGNCGFSSHSLMWQCPSCREWGSCRPITGAAHVN